MTEGTVSWKVLAAVTAAYLYISYDMLRSNSRPDALIWAGYSIANIGFIWKMLT